MCSGRYPTNVVCSMQFYRNGGDIEAARPATKLEFQNSQVTIAVIMSPFSVCYFHSPQPRNAEISIPWRKGGWGKGTSQHVWSYHQEVWWIDNWTDQAVVWSYPTYPGFWLGVFDMQNSYQYNILLTFFKINIFQYQSTQPAVIWWVYAEALIKVKIKKC